MHQVLNFTNIVNTVRYIMSIAIHMVLWFYSLYGLVRTIKFQCCCTPSGKSHPREISCPRATRENSWRQQPRELRPKHRKNDTHPKDNSGQMKIRKKGMSTENNIGVQTRAMAQWVDNEANPEQVQKTTDQATTPTIELHRTKEDTIKEFI